MASSEDNIRFDDHVQLTLINSQGIIQDSENTLFDWKVGSSIYDTYPFFEIIRSILAENDEQSNEINFPCIHFDQIDIHRICDVTIKLLPDQIAIVVFDYTKKYTELNILSQQKNESILKSQQLELENTFLLQKEQFKNDFIANINHEIRTPLTTILGFTEILENTTMNFDQEELIRIIKRETNHLKKMIDDMLNISVIEAGKLVLENERFNFEALILGFKTAYTLRAKEKGITFECYTDPNIQTYFIGDKTRIYQIVDNLLNNAFKFTEEGKISLLITKNYQRSNKVSLNIKIIDSGIGIPEENRDSIFDRFSRLHKDDGYPGTGLGLSIVKSLIVAMNGDIKATSITGEGTTFTINIQLETELKAEKQKKVAFPQYPILKGKQKFRILLVEDKEITQYLVMKILINHGNFYVDVAMNGAQAISYVENRRYDLILMDLKMPKMDGHETTRLLRKNYGDKEISEIPIIGFTAKTNANEEEKCIASGMNDFIQKPFAQEELLSKIGKHLTKRSESLGGFGIE